MSTPTALPTGPTATATVAVTTTPSSAQSYPPVDTSPAIIAAAIIAVMGVTLTGLITYVLGKRNSSIAKQSADAATSAAGSSERSSNAAQTSAAAATTTAQAASAGVEVARANSEAASISAEAARVSAKAASLNVDAATSSAAAANRAAGAAEQSASAADKAAGASILSANAAEAAASQLNVWRQREESMRMLRWAVDNTTADDPKRSKSGQAALEALRTTGNLLQPIDENFFDAVLEGILSSVMADLGADDEVYVDDGNDG